HRLKHRHWTGVSPEIQDARAQEREDSAADDPDNGRLWNLAAALLTSEQHSAVLPRDAEDITHQPITRVLGPTQSAVRVMLLRAREMPAAHVGRQSSELQQHQPRPAAPSKPLDRPISLSRSIEGGVPCTSR